MTDDVRNRALVRWFNEFAEQGIFTTDVELRVTGWNRWLERHSGRSSHEVVGRPLFELYLDLEERGLAEHYREALAGHAYLVSHLLHGHLLPMRAHGDLPAPMRQRARIAPLTMEERVVGTITVIDDVTERVASEQELRRQIEAQRAARQAAEDAVRVKDEFLATLSHEIRTPLNAVLGWARILRDHQLDPELVSRGISVIDRNTTVQMRMIDDLLDTSRIMAGKLRLEMQPVDLVPVAIAALDVVTPAADAKGVRITRRLDPHVARVLGDPDRLQQVLWNLLSNAVKFTDRGQQIDFRLEHAGQFARIVVSDTGRGIAPEFLPHIFDRFRQEDPLASRREGGLGLGLALVKELVLLHGGTIQASSDGEGTGSTFVVNLPALRPAQEEAPVGPLARRGSGDALRGLQVLVVEDDSNACALLNAALSRHGARITAVRSVAEAIEALGGDGTLARPDVVVADLAIAGLELMERLRALERVRDSQRVIPAVATSVYVGPEHRQLAKSAGFATLVSKPLDADDLVRAVMAAVRPDA